MRRLFIPNFSSTCHILRNKCKKACKWASCGINFELSKGLNQLKSFKIMKKKIMKVIAYWMRVWRRENYEVKTSSKARMETRLCPAGRMQSATTDLTEQVTRFLQAGYEFRYNQLTEETEFRPVGTVGENFSSVGKRELNSFCLEAHAQGISCWDKDISRYLYSTCISTYHPFRLYLEELPVWDGIDRLDSLARRVSSEPLWVHSFHTWMLALTAQWQGTTGKHANGVAPILVSSVQGCLKSTFCKSLMPPELSRYYSDEVDLNSRGNVTRKMSEMGLLNLDEFDKYPVSKMPLLKNLMQMADLNLCKAYQKNYHNLPRIASFIGTSNRFDLLSDPTGSRRFLCVEVKEKINCMHIDHMQIYAQLKRELQEGARFWFTAAEEYEIQQHNELFRRRNLISEVLFKCFRPATPRDAAELVHHFSAADIFAILKKQNPAALRGVNPNSFSQLLAPSGFLRVRGHYANYYPVISLIESPSAL